MSQAMKRKFTSKYQDNGNKSNTTCSAIEVEWSTPCQIKYELENEELQKWKFKMYKQDLASTRRLLEDAEANLDKYREKLITQFEAELEES